MTNKRLHKGIDKVIQGLKESGNDFHNKPSLRYFFRIFIRRLNLYVNATFFFLLNTSDLFYMRKRAAAVATTPTMLSPFLLNSKLLRVKVGHE